MAFASRGKRLFSFAVISDTHLNDVDFGTDSPFEVNRLANRRLRYVVEDLNHKCVSFVVHLGDVVHPVPGKRDLYQGAAECFFDQVKHLMHPLKIIPGNHDVGDKPMNWGPAGQINQAYVDAWTRHFGQHYFAHEHQQILFLGINAQLLGSGLALEQEQRTWLLDQLNQHAEKRKFLFSHYPPFLLHADEDEHYDNLSPSNRDEMLKLISEFRIEGLFAGHVHHFWYNKFELCDIYLLPSTAFTRQDYSEMFRTSPSRDHGRDDWAKLGYLLVHVYENGHEIEFVRSYGRQVEQFSEPDGIIHSVEAVTPNTNKFPALGIDLRHDWHEIVQIPPSGGLDEFDRKVVRNDYGFLALWEMGVRHLRIPFSDLADVERRRRLHELHHLGFVFTLYSGIPDNEEIVERMMENSQLFEAWQLIGYLDQVSAWVDSLCDDVRSGLPPLFFSPLKRKSEIVQSGQQYFHVINHGFTVNDITQNDAGKFENLESWFEGIVLRCGISESVYRTIEAVASSQRIENLISTIHVRLSSDNPAHFQDDEDLICRRVAESILHSWRFSGSRVFVDTFLDNDRGYFPRLGLLDREFNPRIGAQITKHLQSLTTMLGKAVDFNTDSSCDGCEVQSVKAANGNLNMIFPLNNGRECNLLDLHNSFPQGEWLNWENGRLESEIPTQPSQYPLAYVSRNKRR